MKKSTLLLVMIVMVTLGVQSQTVLYSDNFDSYTMGGYLSVQDPTWFRTWSNAPGTGQDALISMAFANSPKLSVLITGANVMLLKLGNKTTGTYELKWMMYVESGKAGYYNIHHIQTPGTVNEYAMEVWFHANGSGELQEGGNNVPFTYPKDTWFEVKQIIDLDADDIKLYINGTKVGEWPFYYQSYTTSGTNQLGGVDFFAGAKPGSDETPKYFFDDLSFKELPVTNPSPDWLWEKSINGTTSNTRTWGTAITIDKSGNIYTTGNFTGTVDFDPGVGTSDLTSFAEGSGFISKTDAAGNFVWAKRMGGTKFYFSASITNDAQGNVYTTGNFNGTVDFNPGTGVFNLTSGANGDVFISKLDKQGNFVWAKSIFGLTSKSSSQVSSIALDAYGNVYTTGIFSGTEDFNPGTETFNITASGGRDIFISKLDSLGNFVWAKTMGGPSQTQYLVSNDIALDSSGNDYTTGFLTGTVDFDPGTGVYNLTSDLRSAFISKLDASGNFIWVKQIGGASSTVVSGNSIALDVSGNIYTTGYFNNTVDFDPGSEIFNLTAAGGQAGIFVSKYTNSGNFVWAKAMGGAGFFGGASIALDSFGNVFTTGDFRGTVDFDPGAGMFNLTSVAGSGGSSAFISEFDNLGNFNWAKSIAGATGGTQSSSVSCNSIAIDSANNAFVTGYFDTPFVSFGTIKLTNTSSSTGFIARLDDKTTGIEKVVKRVDTFSVFPNPTNGKFTINSNSTLSSVEIYNLLGARIYSDIKPAQQTSCEIDLAGQTKGIYLVKIMTGTKSSSRKIVLQ